MHPLLYRNDAGQIAIRWWKLIGWLAAYASAMLLSASAFWYFLDGRFPTARLLFVLVLCALPMLLALYVAKRHAEGRTVLQFSLTALLAAVTIFCALLAAALLERRSGLEIHAQRARLEKALFEIVGNGTVRVRGTTTIQVRRTTFDDDDLQKITDLCPELDAALSPLTILDLSGTNVTDAEINARESAAALDILVLNQTGVTDRTIDTLDELPNLRLIAVTSTRVKPQRLATLGRERPDLNIEPKAYLKLKTE